MNYVQGTVVRRKVTFTNPDTLTVFDPTDVQLTVEYPNETVTTTSYVGAQGTVTKISTGIYEATIDTSGQSGLYEYEIAGLGSLEVRFADGFWVSPKLGP